MDPPQANGSQPPLSFAEKRQSAVQQRIEALGAALIVEKLLSASDLSSGRVVVPKAVAEQWFPRLDPSVSCCDLRAEGLEDQQSYTLRFRQVAGWASLRDSCLPPICWRLAHQQPSHTNNKSFYPFIMVQHC